MAGACSSMMYEKRNSSGPVEAESRSYRMYRELSIELIGRFSAELDDLGTAMVDEFGNVKRMGFTVGGTIIRVCFGVDR